ncbi:hypothetical protein V8E54_008750 [Elaphomyces granulatus]
MIQLHTPIRPNRVGTNVTSSLDANPYSQSPTITNTSSNRPESTPTPNPAGTNLHVNSGCVLLINGSPRCNSNAGAISDMYGSFYNIASDPSQPYCTANIISGFNNTSQNSLKATATCQLNARWPATYGDVYFGADGCLYDSSSNKIFDQCCGPPDPNNSGLATNPYCAPAPPSPSQVSFNKEGSSICLSIHSDSCKSGAQRFQDNTVYHQYTSSVWPDSTGTDIVNEIFAIIPTGILSEIAKEIEGMFGIYYGCTVIWACDNSDAYHQGMTGAQIKDATDKIKYFYSHDDAKTCGSTYLSNSCHVTINGCDNCRDEGGANTLHNPFIVANGTSPDAGDGCC